MDTPSRTILEAASWRLGSELVRRHPHDLTLALTAPGDGMYDELEVRAAHGELVSMNRHGQIKFPGATAGAAKPRTWHEYLSAADPRQFVAMVERVVGLPPVGQTPASTPNSLVFRLLATLAAEAVLAEPVTISMGFVDSAGMGGGPSAWWDEFTSTEKDLTEPRSDDPFGQPGYRFWRCERSDLEVTLEVTSGTAWGGRGERVDLTAAYRAAGRRLPVLAGDLWRWGRPEVER